MWFSISLQCFLDSSYMGWRTLQKSEANVRDYVSCLGGECLGVELEEVGQEREV